MFLSEGGSIHVDGEGTLMTTSECLLQPNKAGPPRCRNPGLSKQQIESTLCRHLGVSKVLWVPRGVAGDDDTNGHVDNMVCFVRPGVVALHWADADEDPEQHARSQEALEYLASQTDAAGRKLDVVKVFAPRALVRTAAECKGIVKVHGTFDLRAPGEALPGSYINFYLPTGGVVVPQFGDVERDALAVAVLQRQFPDREVVPVLSRDILCGGGNIHCITMQQPLPA